MSIKHMILGCLMSKPLHGYAIKKHFLKRAQGINEGQMYTLLKQMEKEELVYSTWEENREGKPSRKVYCLTSRGKEAFLGWLTSSEEGKGEIPFDFFQKDPFLKKLAYFKHLQVEQAIRLIEKEIERNVQKIEEFKRVKQKMIERNVPFLSLEIIKYAIEQEKLRCRWLRGLQERLSETQDHAFLLDPESPVILGRDAFD